MVQMEAGESDQDQENERDERQSEEVQKWLEGAMAKVTRTYNDRMVEIARNDVIIQEQLARIQTLKEEEKKELARRASA